MTEYEMKQAVLALITGADFLRDEQVDVPNSQGFTPPDDVWIRVGFSGASGVFSGFGDMSRTQRTGLLQIQCFIRAGQYTQPLDDLTEKLVKLLEWHFSDGFELQAADVITVGRTSGVIASGQSVGGEYYQQNINIPFLIKH